ncbi:SPFH domain-containing protein [Streptomyces atratus]|uniref:SPFH domain / Band 7 family protein n=1 Tax=Streptomyces atratus TaxID=1893 RepID=A0A1K2EZJ6_STRAR|nr:flotillin family protein [Streptomyces atratus]SFY41079.1 SPFH domain / Band 7 family protein [Streptomyces atratus]
MFFWHVPAPNEAMLISGSKGQTLDTQFRIVTGHGSFVLPVKQKARMLSLALREAEITEDCVTQQGIRLNVRAVAVFKVGDDAVSIANAARRFLTEQDQMEELVGRIFAGHLRSIVGGLTVEQIIRERNRVSQEVIAGSHGEMEKLGIVVDALQIQEIDDATGYIKNLAAPHAAAVASQARIAEAKADQEASQREQQAAALKAEYERDTAIKRAGFLAETEQYNARAAQAGPLAQARASHEVIEEQTALAERQAALAAQRLKAEVGRPADAEAYRQRTLAEAARDRVKFEADGNAYTERTLAQAQADANSARAASLRDGNQELIAANRIVENLPALADAAARGMSGADLTVLNGTNGVNEMAAGVVGQGLAILHALQRGANPMKPPAVDGKAASTPRISETNPS